MVKQFLVRRGPDFSALRLALLVYARRMGFKIHYAESRIVLSKAERRLVLSRKGSGR